MLTSDGERVEFSAWDYAALRCQTLYASAGPGDDDEDEIDATLFPFRHDERWIADELLSLVKVLINREIDSPATVRDLATVAHALKRLPAATQNVHAVVSIVVRAQSESVCYEFEITEFRLAFGHGGHVTDPVAGSDSFHRTLLEMEVGGFRDGDAGPYAVNGWAAGARELLSDGAAVEVSNFSGSVEFDTTQPDVDLWTRLPNSSEYEDQRSSRRQ